ncbi:MAG TPA: NAD(P)H-dependent oxidoreductase [Methanoregulaceae archaeon]|nr:NAD(P)H-dependent oxidoreductase [Methanoregulaceae archaeon]
MKTVCAYYSWKGHTRKVAEQLCKAIGAEPSQIIPEKEPSGMAGNAMRALFGFKSPIKAGITDLSGYDALVLASPVWAQKVPPYVNEYIDRLTNCNGKRCYVLVEMGGSGAEKAIRHLKGRLETKGLILMGSAFTIEKDVDSGDFLGTVRKFAESIPNENQRPS